MPISKLLPRGLSSESIEFLEKCLTVSYDKRMGPEELVAFMDRFNDTTSYIYKSSANKDKGSKINRNTETSFKHSEED